MTIDLLIAASALSSLRCARHAGGFCSTAFQKGPRWRLMRHLVGTLQLRPSCVYVRACAPAECTSRHCWTMDVGKVGWVGWLVRRFLYLCAVLTVACSAWGMGDESCPIRIHVCEHGGVACFLALCRRVTYGFWCCQRKVQTATAGTDLASHLRLDMVLPAHAHAVHVSQSVSQFVLCLCLWLPSRDITATLARSSPCCLVTPLHATAMPLLCACPCIFPGSWPGSHRVV